jgi:hypothetical protein
MLGVPSGLSTIDVSRPIQHTRDITSDTIERDAEDKKWVGCSEGPSELKANA